MATLTPVDYDPFAQAGPKLTPVDYDPFATDAPKARTAGEETARQSGLGMRNVIEGAAQTAGIVYDPLAVIGNKILPGDPFVSANYLGDLTADKLGLPEAENGYERVAGGVVRAVTGAGGMVGIGKGVGGVVGNALAAKPGAQIIASATGGASAEVAREAGAGPVGQLVAGVAGAFAPSAAAGSVRAAMRGGEVGRQNMLANIETFERAGAGTPTVGQATEGRIARGAEALLSRAPGGAGRMAGVGEQQQAGIGAQVREVADSLSTKASPEQAGRGIERGITGPGGFMSTFRRTANGLYGVVDQFVPPATPIPVTRTKAVVDQLASPTPGAEQTSRALASPKLAQLQGALDADLQASIAAAGRGELPYEAVKALRTRLGELIADSTFATDVPTKQLKAVYGALSDDMNAAVRATGNPQAVQAVQRANAYYRAGMNRMEELERVVERNGGPEKVFAAATGGTREGATTVRAVMQSLPEEGQKQLAAAVIRRLGRAKAGVQDSSGDAFSTETFLTNWSNLAPEAKSAMFARFGPGYLRDMEAVAKAAGNVREGASVFRNPSGTTQGSLQAMTGATFALSVIGGNLGAAASVAGAVAGANLAARAMTSPIAVKFLARQTSYPLAALPTQIALLKAEATASGDETALELARALESAEQVPQAPANNR